MSKSTRIDILLLLEGTYPYVKGGVSSWMHTVIRGLDPLRFGIVFLGSRERDYHGPQYELPSNVVHMQTHFVFDAFGQSEAKVKQRLHKADPRIEARMADFHDGLRLGRAGLPDIGDINDEASAIGKRCFYESESAWNYITDNYRQFALADSFVDYFWSVRNMHAPVWLLGDIAASAPAARMLFSPSTGYAGLLGAMLARERDAPFVLMEHGIYTRERRIDMMNAGWVRDRRNFLQTHQTEISHLRTLWVRFFESSARQIYLQADPVISLFERARRQQVADGAIAARTRVVPNGVDVSRFAQLRRPAGAPVPMVMALIGRVVPIKDIKNFIRAAAVTRHHLTDIRAWIVGPTEEDPDYAAECQELVQSLQLEDTVEFLGFRRVDEVLPKVGVNVLSSVSEGLPLSVLEGFAAGLPAVTTDVGACRELIEGSGGEDDVPGSAGGVAGLADPDGLAEHVVRLLGDAETYRRAVQTAISRVEKRYRLHTMLDTFDQVFREAMR